MISLRLKLKDLGPLKFFLGLEIARSAKVIHVSEEVYTRIVGRGRVVGFYTSKVPCKSKL